MAATFVVLSIAKLLLWGFFIVIQKYMGDIGLQVGIDQQHFVALLG
jgi:hypothetical protein